MVDIETWGTSAGSDIRSIGAVVFDPIKKTTSGQFYINLKGGEDFGLIKNSSTVKWWAEQSQEAQKVLLKDQVDFKKGLEVFSEWWLLNQEGKPTREKYATFWANGSHFDYVLLNAAFEAAGVKVPWIYRAPRDCKTIWDAAGDVEIPFSGVEHNALDDAYNQALCVIKAYNQLGIN